MSKKAINFKLEEDTYKPKHHHYLLPPDYLRGMVIGASNTGKTHFLLNFLKKLQNPDVVFIISKTTDQAAYKAIIKGYEEAKIPVEVITHINNIDEFINENKLAKINHGLVILDDLEKNEMKDPSVINLFTRGRHLHLSVIMVTQDWFSAPLGIRKNINFAVLFSTNSSLNNLFTDLRRFFTSKKQFELILKTIWNTKYNYLYVDLQAPNNKLALRRNFDELITVD